MDVSTGAAVAANLERVSERIARAAERSGRLPSDVILVAVTKTVATERILEAIAAGVTHFGENRVQEAEAKYGPGGIPREGLTLHMIGTLQRNKARRAAALFDWVQSVDRPEIARALDSAAAKPLPVLLEVNLTGEPSKSGVAPGDLPALAGAVTACARLRPVGLMTIARLDAPEAELRRTFAGLRDLLEKLRSTHPGDWRHLSMGMSDDYEIAIEEGANIVRLGRAIFGERPPAR
ncbi:MAG TPA: YggS family pyridoxal phosphate-dependent enzyme [Chloroflexia bacterium]|nr:YggS family pyridoxal phosphate-dependent enzyme [Chloroflexia bacterium]